MTRVMQVMAGAVHGGAETFFTRLAPALSRAGTTQQIVIRQHPERAASLRAEGLSVIELGFGGMLDLVTGHRLSRAVSLFDPDILLSWMNRATKFCPIGQHVFAARLGGYYKLENYRRCDHLVGNTKDICDYLVAEGWPSHRTWYLPNFVGAETAQPIPRATLDTPEDAPLLLALGRLHENKAFDVLLEALTRIPQAYLWLAGDGPLKNILQAHATRLNIANRVRFLGWRNDVPALFAACDAFVCPSRHEPLGNVVIEAWAQHRPLVATQSQGPSALIEDGVSGLLVPVDDAESLADSITRVIKSPDLAAALVSGGRVAYEADFTESAVVSRYLEFFERVTN
ncbi:MAG: glycosyltransferase [Alphaproteobacteria bacterium]|nr:glycosyltransferase [Alphaproteobacteria bacterium]